MNKTEHLKHRVLEVLEGGLRGSTGARVFSWVAFVLILLSNSFFLLSRLETPGEKTALVFKIVEAATILLFTAEVLLGLWTADIRYPEEKRPRLRYLREPMTIVAILAILPFYAGLILRDTRFYWITEAMSFLTLLHLVKAWNVVMSNRD